MLFWICPIHFPEHPEQTRTEQTPCSVRIRLEQNFLGSLLVRFGSFRTMALFCSASNRTNRTNSNLHCSASHLCFVILFREDFTRIADIAFLNVRLAETETVELREVR